ncbi:hypothetical protein [Haloferula sp.]|uniref:hypothetical protein n=1 Tax=Haloferula sp. TaxID=2497595 RepID=UPI00329B0AAB
MPATKKYWGIGVAVGCLAWITVAASLHKGGHFDHKPNVLTLKGSPYGRTLAYAMRGPADLYWHRGQTEEHGDVDENRETLGLEGDDETLSLASSILKMRKEFDEEEAAHEAEATSGVEEAPPAGLRERLLWEIGRMRTTYYSRTNNFGDTPQIVAWRFGETEKRLKLSHELDPTNLICYGSYFMFLSESVSRLRGAEDEEEVIAQRQEKALRVAISTLQACTHFPDEPTALITAASAANDAVSLLNSSKRAKPGAADEMRRIFSATLGQYVERRDAMIADGSWDGFSVYRQHEMEEVFTILRVIHLASEGQASAGNESGAH